MLPSVIGGPAGCSAMMSAASIDDHRERDRRDRRQPPHGQRARDLSYTDPELRSFPSGGGDLHYSNIREKRLLGRASAVVQMRLSDDRQDAAKAERLGRLNLPLLFAAQLLTCNRQGPQLRVKPNGAIGWCWGYSK